MKAFTIDVENNIAVHASAKATPKTEGTQLFTSEDALAELAAAWPASRMVEIYNSLTGVTPVKKFTSRGTAVARIWKAIQTLGEAEAPQSADAATEQAPAKKKASRAKKAPKPPQEAEADVPAPVAPHAPDAAPEGAPANGDATPPSDAPAAAGDEKLLRALSRAFAGLTPEQQEEKWVALKSALATMKPAAPRQAATSGAPREGSKISQVIALLKREGGVTLEEIMRTMEWQKHTARALMSAGGALAKKHGLTVVSTKGENGERTYSLAS
jgi:hypothetical protein